VKVSINREAWPGPSEYALVPIAFAVERVLDIGEPQGGRFRLSERGLSVPYVKDYDVVEGPESWVERFDLNRWVFLAARIGDERVGGAALALTTPGVTDPNGRQDLAVLWDLRVAPAVRRQGIGAMLLQAAEREAR
jgi:ribosomal protein S18 acetylase RimI-like enzyme